jgi:hypothetical protein
LKLETERKKKEPESVVWGEAVAKTTIDLSKGEDMANVEVREYGSEDKDRKRIEFKGRGRSRRKLRWRRRNRRVHVRDLTVENRP